MIRREYFEWLSEKIGAGKGVQPVSYRKLLHCLHSIEFRWSIPNDANRAEDGISLRYRFAHDDDIYLDGPCSVFEMLAALAIYCEESIMDDPNIGDRTGQWFWGMIVNLGLGSMTDDVFDRREVERRIDIFLDREYKPNGVGGLFTIENCDRDLRDVEIIYQLYWYLDSREFYT